MSLEVGCCGIEGVVASQIAGRAPPASSGQTSLASRDRNGEVAA